jgi:hypothetical protein
MLPRRGISRHVIYDDGVRRGLWVCLGALVFCLVAGAAGAQTGEPVPTTAPVDETTTTITAPSTTTTTTRATTTTTTRSSPSTTTAVNRSPVPPPASGPSQTLVPALLGTPVDVTTTTGFTTTSMTHATIPTQSEEATRIASRSNSPSGLTLALAGVAWLASLGGLLVYAEDRRSMRWKHLAR